MQNQKQKKQSTYWKWNRLNVHENPIILPNVQLISWLIKRMITPTTFITFQIFWILSADKNSGWFSNLFLRYSILKMLQSDCWRSFYPTTWEPYFSQIWDLCWHMANMNFHHKFFKECKKIILGHSGPILPISGKINFFLKNPFSPFLTIFG